MMVIFFCSAHWREKVEVVKPVLKHCGVEKNLSVPEESPGSLMPNPLELFFHFTQITKGFILSENETEKLVIMYSEFTYVVTHNSYSRFYSRFRES